MGLKPKFWIVEPMASINECENPLPWTLDGITVVGGGTVEISTQRMRNGGPVLLAHGATVWWNKPMNKLKTGEQYELLLNVWAPNNTQVEVEICTSSGTSTGTSQVFDFNGEWRWCRVPFVVGAAGLTFRVLASDGQDFYVDRISVQKGENMTWFCGYGFTASDNQCFRWEGEPMNSRSVHNGLCRRAGKMVDIDELMIVEQAPGLGMGDWEQRMTPVMTGGALYQDHYPVPRYFSLQGTAVSQDYKELFLKRKALSLLVRPDTKGEQLLNLLYQGIDSETGLPMTEELTLECACIWGLRDVPDLPTYASQQIDFVMPDPHLYANHYDGYKQGDGVEITSDNIVMRRKNGEWKALPGLDGEVKCVAVDTAGRIWAGGTFTGKIKWWNGTSWRKPVAGGAPDGDVNAIAVLPSGDIYIGGDFTYIGSNLHTRVASLRKITGQNWWDPTQMGTGCNATVRAIHIDDTGNVIVGGDFTTAGGKSSVGVAMYNPSNPVIADRWTGFGTALSSGAIVRSICNGGYPRRVALGGAFQASAASSIKNLAFLNTDNGQLSSFGDVRTYPTMNTEQGIQCVTRLADGSTAYAGTLVFPGPLYSNAHDVGMLRGMRNMPFNDDFIVEILAGATFIMQDSSGDITVVGGADIWANREKIGRFAKLKSGEWVRHEEINVISESTQYPRINTIVETPNGDMIYAGSWTGAIRVPPPPDAMPVVTQSTAGTYPIVRVFGRHRVRSFYNRATGKTIRFRNTLIPEGGWLECSLRPDKIQILHNWKNRLDLIDIGSDLTDFWLEPGRNDIVADTTPYPEDNITDINRGDVFVLWQPRYWSLEGATHGAL